MAKKNSFVLQTKLKSVVSKLSDKQAGVLFKSILDYAADGTLANFEDGMVDVVFEMVKQDLDYTAQKYAETCAKRAESGRLGGLANQANASKCKQMLETESKTKQSQAKSSKAKHNDNDNDVDNEFRDKSLNINPPNISPLKGGKFTKPTVEQVAAYCLERNNGINAQQFVDFYESKGWKVGSSPMKDWQAAVRNWERRNSQEKNEHGTDYNRNPEPNKYAGFGRKIQG